MKLLSNLLVVAVVATIILFAGDALASTSSASFDIVLQKVAAAFRSSKLVIFIVGGFGLIAVAFLAIFGKLQWKWFVSLLIGLAIVAAAGMIIDYSTGDAQTKSRTSDTFQASINK